MPHIEFRTSGCVVEFADGTEVNILRVAIRRSCGVPYKCASGNCGTDRVHVEAGGEHLSPVRPKERERLGDLVDDGWRLACQTYAAGDVTVTWDPDQRPLEGRAAEKLQERWLSAADDEGARADVG
jgi:ferredoxin